MAVNQAKLMPRSAVPVMTPAANQDVLINSSGSVVSIKCRQISSAGVKNDEKIITMGTRTIVAAKKGTMRQAVIKRSISQFSSACNQSMQGLFIAGAIHQFHCGCLQLSGFTEIHRVLFEIPPRCDKSLRLYRRIGRVFHIQVGE